MSGRGELTDFMQLLARKHGMTELTTAGLRLMPYIHFRLINHHNLDPNHLSSDDRKVLSKWRKEKWIEGGASARSLKVSGEFWNIMNDLIWWGYVVPTDGVMKEEDDE
jgi:hypothetical protein